jgi:hypothetical protein
MQAIPLLLDFFLLLERDPVLDLPRVERRPALAQVPVVIDRRGRCGGDWTVSVCRDPEEEGLAAVRNVAVVVRGRSAG